MANKIGQINNIVKLSSKQYEVETKSNSTLYWLTDTKELYVGIEPLANFLELNTENALVGQVLTILNDKKKLGWQTPDGDSVNINEVDTPPTNATVNVYSRNSAGGIEGVGASVAEYSDNLVRRDSNGCAYVSDPTEDKHAVNLEYFNANKGGGGVIVNSDTLPEPNAENENKIFAYNGSLYTVIKGGN